MPPPPLEQQQQSHGLRDRTVHTFTPVPRPNCGPPPLLEGVPGHRARTHSHIVAGKHVGQAKKKRALKKQVKKTLSRAERCIVWIKANGERVGYHYRAHTLT